MTYISAELRQLVRERAHGCCEYCRMPDDDAFRAHEIDHIEAEKHGGTTTEGNLCFCCWICNRHKGTDLTSRDPETGEITLLYHPRKDLWSDHFRLNGAQIEALTPVGRVTVRLLQMNKSTRIKEREILISLNRFPH
jgi:hypothetical protein